MSDFMKYDPWAQLTSRNGIAGDELVSSLQKCIRRGLEVEAVEFAYEMYITSEPFEDKLWRRLLAISVEDIGFGDLNAANVVNTLNNIRKNFPYNDGDRPLFFIHAIRYLCSCEKDRSSDHLKNIVKIKANRGYAPTPPDFAIDLHTQRGQKMGKDVKHFLEHASKIDKQIPIENDYKEQLLALIEKESESTVAEQPFTYNTWQT